MLYFLFDNGDFCVLFTSSTEYTYLYMHISWIWPNFEWSLFYGWIDEFPQTLWGEAMVSKGVKKFVFFLIALNLYMLKLKLKNIFIKKNKYFNSEHYFPYIILLCRIFLGMLLFMVICIVLSMCSNLPSAFFCASGFIYQDLIVLSL